MTEFCLTVASVLRYALPTCNPGVDDEGIPQAHRALFFARTLEFVRDRAALVWNLLFPLLLVIGFSLIFSGPPKPLVQIGVVGNYPQPMPAARRAAAQDHPL